MAIILGFDLELCEFLNNILYQEHQLGLLW